MAKICILCRDSEAGAANLGGQHPQIDLGVQAKADCARPKLTALQLPGMRHMRSNKTPAIRLTCATVTTLDENRLSTTMLLSELVADYGVLESVKCRCSKTKTIGIAFCDTCWSGLSSFHQRALRSARPASGFATAYWAAASSLDIKSGRDTRPYSLFRRRT